MMKRIFAFLLLFVLLLSLAACGGDAAEQGTGNTPDTSSTPAQSTPDNTIPEQSDWVGIYTKGSATISITDDGNRNYFVTLSIDGETVTTGALNAGRITKPGEPMMAGSHDDPWKSIDEYMVLLLSEDYQTLTLSVLNLPTGDLIEYNADDFLGEYTRQ